MATNAETSEQEGIRLSNIEPRNSPERRSSISSSSSSNGTGNSSSSSPSLRNGHDTCTSGSGSHEGSMTALFQSPTSYTAGFSQEAGSPGQLRARKTTTRSVVPSVSADKQPKQQASHVADTSLSKALLRSIIHIISILITAILIIFCATKAYFGDLDGFPNQDVIFEALQFVVKGHEIIMTMSIAEIVLHRIRWDLLNNDGVPFGFLSAAYQLSDAIYLISTEFRACAWTPWAHDKSFRRLSLTVLIVGGIVLSLTVGPSSGVLMIPKLKWWPLKKPYGTTSLRLFASSSPPDLLWPSELPSYDCAGWLCPSFGVTDIAQWVSSLQFTGASGQVPFTDGGDNFYRWLISDSPDYDGWTVATSPMMGMSTVLGGYWNWVAYQMLGPTVDLKQPQLSLAFADTQPILQPLVQVQCSAFTSNKTISQTITLPNDQLRVAQTDAYNGVVWPVPDNYTSITVFDLLSYDWNLYWAKLSMDGYESAPTASLIFVMPDDDHTRTIVPCSVLGHWVEGEIAVEPKTDRNIQDSRSNPLDVINSSYVDLSPSNQISFSDDWWTLTMAGALDGAPTSLDSVMYGLTMGPCDGCLDSYTGGTQGLAYRVSTILGMYFTDAIARYVPDTHHVIFQDSKDGSTPFAEDLANFNSPPEIVPTGYTSWLKYAEDNPQGWREATVTVKRYGYAWSFEGVLVKFATAALLAQSCLAIGHIALTLYGRWTSQAWDSIGAMIALALRSPSSAVLPDQGTGDEEKETWAEIMSVRAVDKDLELHFVPSRVSTLKLIRN